jgi:hypothetical protein
MPPVCYQHHGSGTAVFNKDFFPGCLVSMKIAQVLLHIRPTFSADAKSKSW